MHIRQSRGRPQSNGVYGPIEHSTAVYEILEEASGRARVHRMTQDGYKAETGEDVVYDVEDLAVFDGVASRVLNSSLNGPIGARVQPERDVPIL